MSISYYLFDTQVEETTKNDNAPKKKRSFCTLCLDCYDDSVNIILVYGFINIHSMCITLCFIIYFIIMMKVCFTFHFLIREK